MAETPVPEKQEKVVVAEATSKPGPNAFIPGMEDMELLPLKDYFDITDSHDYGGWKEDLREILRWGKDAGFKDKEEMLQGLKQLENRLGSDIQSNRLTKVRHYLSLERKLSAIKREQRALEK